MPRDRRNRRNRGGATRRSAGSDDGAAADNSSNNNDNNNNALPPNWPSTWPAAAAAGVAASSSDAAAAAGAMIDEMMLQGMRVQMINEAMLQGMRVQQRGLFGPAAILYLKTLRARSVRDVPKRFCLFELYLNILLEDDCDDAVKQDIAETAESEFVDNPQEAPVYRIEAACKLGRYYDQQDPELAADFYREVISMYESPRNEEENNRLIMTPRRYTMISSEVMVRWKDQAVAHLKSLAERVEAKSEYDRRHYFERLLIGGQKCDHCSISLEAAGVSHLKCCDRCGSAYYCSRACQKKQWWAGHKDACREPDQIEIGDDMRLFGLTGRTELNGRVVRVHHRLRTEPNRISVELQEDNSRPFKVAIDKLHHLRPKK